MNGSNTIVEGRRKPFYLCPICLRKLQSMIGFDVIERYHKLIEVLDELDNPYFDPALEFYKNRYKFLVAKAKKSMCNKPVAQKLGDKPKPKVKVVKTVTKKKKLGKSGPMPADGMVKAQASLKKMTAIERLIWEKKNKKK